MDSSSDLNISDLNDDIYYELCQTPTMYISPRELFDVMLANDGTICFISMVERIDSKTIVQTKNGEVERCRVILTNNNDWKVQVTIWGDNIKRVIHNFKMSFVIHVSGAFSQLRYPTSLGNVPMDLTIKDYTIINVIGKIQNSEKIKSYEPITIQNILNAKTKYVTLEAFLKYNFTEETFGEPICISSVGIDKYRFEVRCKDRQILEEFKAKTKLRISGILHAERMPNFLLVENVSDIKVIPGTISDEDLTKAMFLPRKRKPDDEINMENEHMFNL